MFAPLTFRLINFCLLFGFYAVGIPLQWNRTKLRVEYIDLNNYNVFFRFWCKYAARIVVITFSIISIYSVCYILHFEGFDLFNIRFTFQIITLCIAMQSNIFVLTMSANIHEVKAILNLILVVSERFQAKMALSLLTTKKQKKKYQISNADICNIIFALTILLLTYLPFGFGLMYLTSCKMHFLNIFMPDSTCGTYKSIFHWLFIDGFRNKDGFPMGYSEILFLLVRVLVLTLLQICYYSPVFAAVATACTILYPALFYTHEMFQMLKNLNPSNPFEYKIFIQLYRSLQIEFKHINSTHLTKILLPGHLVPIFFAFLIAFNAIVHNSAPIALLIAFWGFCIVITVHYLFTLALIWKLTTNSAELVLDVKRVSKLGRYEQLYLRTLLPILVRMGAFGALDKDIYTLNGEITIDFTINTLLM